MSTTVTKVKQKILLVEPDPMQSKLISLLINGSDAFCVASTQTDSEGSLKYLKKNAPEIILTELDLPVGQSFDFIAAVQKVNPLIKLIVHTTYSNSDIVIKAIKAGASGYILKSKDCKELLFLLNSMTFNGAALSGKIAKVLVESFYLNPDSPLTRREMEVLKLLSTGKTSYEISQELQISRFTSRAHINNIYSKLNVKSKSQAIKIALSQRYI
jgi:DNA-binding NarL/FixJ family response regulator